MKEHERRKEKKDMAVATVITSYVNQLEVKAGIFYSSHLVDLFLNFYCIQQFFFNLHLSVDMWKRYMYVACSVIGIIHNCQHCVYKA